MIWENGSTKQKDVGGFDRNEWKDLIEEVAEANSVSPEAINWSSFPEWRPGCGSLSVAPFHAARLKAESENSPIRARKIEIGIQDDEFEFMLIKDFLTVYL